MCTPVIGMVSCPAVQASQVANCCYTFHAPPDVTHFPNLKEVASTGGVGGGREAVSCSD